LQRCILLPPADYNLLVYGSLTFDAGYVERCRGLITELNLTKNVELRGLGKPTAVLAQGWCYLQVSSTLLPLWGPNVVSCALGGFSGSKQNRDPAAAILQQPLDPMLQSPNAAVSKRTGTLALTLAAARVSPQSSISEGLPISILEAALCGLCVVCTNVGGCAELLAAPPGEQLACS
jgi:glycosyltransferase involved in cell wall biosynthesis